MISLQIIAGLILLFLGRKLFWLFVGIIGFIVGMNLATYYMQTQPGLVVLVIALAVGLVGALLAIFFQGLAVGVAGFLAGGNLAMSLLRVLNVSTMPSQWLVFIIGGIFGAILFIAVFDWALIALSSIIGAVLITQNLVFARSVISLIFIALLILGILVQAFMLRRERAT